MFHLGLLLHRAVLGVSQAQIHMASWMNDVQVGDTVIETTSFHHPWTNRIGVLIRKYDAPILDEDGVEYANEPHWVLRLKDGELDWHNARFIRIPTTQHQRDLFTGWFATRCSMADCKDCKRERWRTERGREPVQLLRTA